MSDSRAQQDLAVHAVIALDAGRLGLEVSPPFDLGLINRAGQSVYWNRSTRQLEDRYLRETSHVASYRRMANVLLEELRLVLRSAPDLRFEGVVAPDRGEIARLLGAAR